MNKQMSSQLFQICLTITLLLSAALTAASPALAQFTEQGPKLVGAGANGISKQGQSVAVSADGNTAIVGGPADSAARGAAWIYVRSGGIWTQQGAKLIGLDAIGASKFGSSVAISADGNVAIVGGPDDSSSAGAA